MLPIPTVTGNRPSFSASKKRTVFGRRLVVCLLLATTIPCCAQSRPDLGRPEASEESTVERTRDWKAVEQLISEDKFQAALEATEELLQAARANRDPREVTRALIKKTQLRTGLHGYETAVRDLRLESWPEGPQHNLVLSLFYARSLVQYLHAYSWEISQRDRVDTGGTVDLKAWTRDQIAAEAHRTYREVWEQRETWGGESLGDLAEYIQQNDYPARIRGTLRDAVSYLWVEILADTSLWRPEWSNEIWRLDLASLISGPESSDHPRDPESHPLLEISTVLSDLETWHRAHRRPEAAFEARLERYRRLRSAIQGDIAREAIREDLESRLDSLGRGFPWWSMGMSSLAEMLRDDGDLVASLATAEEGLETHPDSPGGKRCRHLVATVTAPAYSLEASTLDGAHRRSIRVSHKNLGALHFRAFSVGTDRLFRSGGAQALVDPREIPTLVSRAEPAVQWTLDLPATPDYQSHYTYTTPPLDGPGLYLVVASTRRDFRQTLDRQAAVAIQVGDLVLSSRALDGGLEIQARSGSTGLPLDGVEIELYLADWRKEGHQRLDRRTTGSDGLARLDIESRHRGRTFVLAHKGDETSLLQTQAPLRPYDDQERTDALIYTDRSVYRPGQELFFKVVAYQGAHDEARFHTLADRAIEVKLLDANGEEVATQSLETNTFGSAAGRFDLPAAGKLLGDWGLSTSLGGFAAIKVEEYKRPTFQVTVADPEESLRLNRPARLAGEARYYFGLPVSSGQVDWRVTRQPVFPTWWWFSPPGSGSSQVVASGSATLRPDGTFEITFTPEADEPSDDERGISYRYQLDAEVTDEGGETRSARRAFRLGFVAVEARVESAEEFHAAGAPVSLRIQRQDLDGLPRAGTASYRLLALEMPSLTLLPAEQPKLPNSPDTRARQFETPGDRLRPRWDPGYDPDKIYKLWPDGKEITRGTLEHDQGGAATLELTDLEPGVYRLRYSTIDDFGAELEIQHEIVVASADAAAPPLPLLLARETPSVHVGDTARLLISSGLENQTMVLELFQSQRRIDRRVLRSGAGIQIVEIPIEARHRGGFSVHLEALRDFQSMRLERHVQVPWTDRELDVEFATFRDRLRPGSKETWKVTLRGADELTLARDSAEVLAYMYDKSLDFFASHTPPRPLDIYPSRIGVPPLQLNLGGRWEIWQRAQGFSDLPPYPTFRGDTLQFYDGYGIGGPGMRYRRGGRMVMKQLASMAPAAPMAAMADSFEAESVTEEIVVTAESPMDALGDAGDNSDGPPPDPPTDEPVRSDFSETAFWFPQLLVGDDGSVSFEFEVPDSVTEWAVWSHALTRDLRSGSVQTRTRTVKDLLVRPYLPRFFREGDRAALKMVVNNASDQTFSGTLDVEILDPRTDRSLLAEFGLSPEQAQGLPFTVEPGGGANLTVPVAAPRQVGPVAFRVVARAGGLSDGELRPLPVLPSRLHLSQSRFVTLRDQDRRTLVFEDLTESAAPSLETESLVVHVDAQLFYSVLDALPYLVSYPYSCTEQTLNRFLSTGILSSLFDDYPAVARMAQEMSQRDTRFEAWQDDDPNRRLLLEETPWLRTSRGEGGENEELLKVLDPNISRAQRDLALAELREAQTASGGFPWWPGGPPSPFITLYLLSGFSRALEFGVEVPQDLVVSAWSYLESHYVDELARHLVQEECCWETITFLNYTLSSYPDPAWTGGAFSDDDREKMLDFSFRNWRKHSPRLKGYLALTLERAERTEDARLVWDSVMDSSHTSRDEGTSWAPEDRAWLWYNDTIETHAMALRTLSELDPDDDRRHGLVQWLLLNKKLGHWKSTRATAEVIYSLAHYLQQEDALATREEVTVQLADRRHTFVFEPDRYTGKNNLFEVDGAEVTPAMGSIEVSKEGKGFAFASATWHFATDELPDEARGDFFSVERSFFRRHHDGRDWVLQPIAEGAAITPGDQLEVQLSIRAKHAAEYVHLRDPRGAGFEPESVTSGYRWDLGLGFYEEIRDSGANFFFEWLPAGEYTFKYRLRANLAGTFRVGPATLQSMYAPEFVAYSSGKVLEIQSEE